MFADRVIRVWNISKFSSLKSGGGEGGKGRGRYLTVIAFGLQVTQVYQYAPKKVFFPQFFSFMKHCRYFPVLFVYAMQGWAHQYWGDNMNSYRELSYSYEVLPGASLSIAMKMWKYVIYYKNFPWGDINVLMHCFYLVCTGVRLTVISSMIFLTVLRG